MQSWSDCRTDVIASDNRDTWKRLPSNAAQVSYGSQGVSGCQAESEGQTEDAKILYLTWLRLVLPL